MARIANQVMTDWGPAPSPTAQSGKRQQQAPAGFPQHHQQRNCHSLLPLSGTGFDQGYLSKALLLRLRQRGLHWVTGIGRNRKNDLLPMLDKVLLRKRCIIKTLFDKLKSSMGLEHTRHRWPVNALVYILFCLAATTLARPKVNIGNIAIPNPMHTIPGIP